MARAPQNRLPLRGHMITRTKQILIALAATAVMTPVYYFVITRFTLYMQLWGWTKPGMLLVALMMGAGSGLVAWILARR